VFSSRIPDISTALPKQAFAVPTDLGRLGLSEIANQLLQFEETIPFDFLI